METDAELNQRLGQTVRTSLTLEPQVLRLSKELAQRSGYQFSFSAYVNEILKKEIQCRLSTKELLLLSGRI